MRRQLVGFGLAVFCLATAHAQQADETVRFRVQAGGRDLYKLAIPAPVGERNQAALVQTILTNDLEMSGLFRALDPKAFLANLAKEDLSIVPDDWKNVGAEGVIKIRLTVSSAEVKLDCRLYEIANGETPVLSKEFRGSAGQLRSLAHSWAAEVVRYFSGQTGFFQSKISFSAPTGQRRRDIFVIDWDGAALQQITNSSQNLLPAWSRSGNELAYTSFIAGKPDLYVVPAGGGKPRVISNRSGLNTGAAFSPDGKTIAATLSMDGNSEIYLLSSNGSIVRRLTSTPFIETSPSWSPDGSQIAFVSDRHGSPQIWVMQADGGGARKITRRGNYNQTPSWCSQAGSKLVAFTGRDEHYSYDIFTINVDSGETVRVTEKHGSNQHPSWSPDCRAIAYESSRGGIWASTADGKTERQLYRGSASAPSWGP